MGNVTGGKKIAFFFRRKKTRANHPSSSNSSPSMSTLKIAQLKLLSEQFGFDIKKAKELLKLEEPKKRGRPPKVQSNKVEAAVERLETKSSRPYDGTTIPSTTSLVSLMKSSKNAQTSGGRGRKTGYHYFLADISQKIKTEMHGAAQLTGEKVPRGAVMAEIGRRWQVLSDAKKRAWNDYAQAQQQ